MKLTPLSLDSHTHDYYVLSTYCGIYLPPLSGDVSIEVGHFELESEIDGIAIPDLIEIEVGHFELESEIDGDLRPSTEEIEVGHFEIESESSGNYSLFLTPIIIPGPQSLNYDEVTDTGYYGYVGSGNESLYDSGTTYGSGAIVKDSEGEIYYSKVSSNQGNALSNVGGENTYWKWIGNGVLVDGATLTSTIELTNGINCHSDFGWLKFYVGKDAACNPYVRRGETAKPVIIFIAYRPYKYNISWNHIYDVGAVFGTGDNGPYNSGSNVTQDASITINDTEYIVRSPICAKENPFPEETSNAWACADNIGDGSEWNDLIYRVHECDPNCTTVTDCVTSNETTRHGGQQDGDNWAEFTDADLITHATAGDGSWTWGQETRGANTTRRVFRGRYGVGGFNVDYAPHTSTAYGFRPVLEVDYPLSIPAGHFELEIVDNSDYNLFSTDIEVGHFELDADLLLSDLDLFATVDHFEIESEISGDWHYVITKDIQSSYDYPLVKDILTEYSLRPVIKKDFESLYSLTISVSKDIESLYSFYLFNNIESNYDVLGSVIKDINTNYSLFYTTIKDIESEYAIKDRNTVKKNIRSIYHLRQPVTTESIITYPDFILQIES